MQAYRRFVSYVYQYENGKKAGNRGFIKVEARGNTCSMNISLKGICRDENAVCSVYGFKREDGLLKGSLLAECPVKTGVVQEQLVFPRNEMGRAKYGLQELSGVIFQGDDQTMYGTQWDDDPMKMENFQPDEKNNSILEEAGEPAAEEAENQQGWDEPRDGEWVTGADSIGEADSDQQYTGEIEAEHPIGADAELPADTAGRLEETAVEMPEEMQEEELPEEEMSEKEMPEEELPEVGTPERELPEKEMPERELPEVEMSEGAVPEVEGPEGQVCEEEVQKVDISENQAVPETAVEEEVSVEVDAEEFRQDGKEAEEEQEESSLKAAEAEEVLTEQSEKISRPESASMNESEENSLFSAPQMQVDREPKNGIAQGMRLRNMPEPEIFPDPETEQNEDMPGEPQTYEMQQEEELTEILDTTIPVPELQEQEPEQDMPAEHVSMSEPDLPQMGIAKQDRTRQGTGAPAPENMPEKNEQESYIKPDSKNPCPFSDGILEECRRIRMNDLKFLDSRDQSLRNNRFVQHGYQMFGHLLLARIARNGQYILGVPGIYQQQEKFMADMFGFHNFKYARRSGSRPSNFGYWYRLIYPPKQGRGDGRPKQG